MTRALYLFVLVSGFLLLLPTSIADTRKPVSTGPENGSLFIVGGAGIDHLAHHFIELAGGTDAAIVIIPTASSNLTPVQVASHSDRWKKLGATNVTSIHSNDPDIANTDSFIEPLLKARAIWFGGGRQWRLVDAYEGTRAEKAFQDVLDRGGVIGGSSAGATIQGSYLVRGDTRNNQIMIGDHEVGFAYLKNVAIDQHHLARNRHFDMYSIRKKYPHLLGIGIDEATAIIVSGNQFKVVGSGYVAIYDDTFWSRESSSLKQLPAKESLFYFLREGDHYDLAHRRVIPSKNR